MNIDHKKLALQPLWLRVLNLAAATGLLVGLGLLWAGPEHAVDIVRVTAGWLLS